MTAAAVVVVVVVGAGVEKWRLVGTGMEWVLLLCLSFEDEEVDDSDDSDDSEEDKEDCLLLCFLVFLILGVIFDFFFILSFGCFLASWLTHQPGQGDVSSSPLPLDCVSVTSWA